MTKPYLSIDPKLNDTHGPSIPPTRRYPIINRGTYLRTTAIDILISRFLATYPTGLRQIISLGAGSDTRFFRFASTANLLYHELDFAANTRPKIAKILSTTERPLWLCDLR